ncbi:glycosyltransferase family 4 protein [Clostridium sp. DJ247]|uniref:glycosyltransferase family 4 protein n=1 Tax=Clostridium sp. DJ247 TaxID=2726188 RepID=UPI001629D706|nr:glycosyltransferase family 4 protein [Clostridium sp. DJ247]MBC2580251.1 glycosyltransferase family 4 protein [Clostridium sp. DJ247]
MKNILVISHMYPSSSNGVLGIFVHKQVQKLIKEGCKVKVICPVPYVPKFLKISKKLKGYIDIPDNAVIDGVEVFYPRYIEIPRGILLQYSGFLMYLGIKKLIKKVHKEFKFHILHAHTAIPVGFSSMILSRRYKVPFVVTIHGQDFQYTMRKNMACKRNVMRVLCNADNVITVSNKLRNMIEDEKVLSKTVVINNGINPEEYKDDDSNNIIEQNSEYTILSVSSLIKTKGIDLNIRAMSQIVKKHPNIKYYIIGGGEEDKSLRKLVDDLALNNNVIFLGKLPHSQVIKYMAKCDIFTLPSWQEGFGIVYIEAMNNGVPVIGVKGQGIEDVIINKENGFLVEPHNVEDLVKTLEYILENIEEAKAIGEQGRKTVLNEYTWLRNAQKTIDIYNDLLNNNE